MASVREALGKFTLAPQIDFDAQSSIDIPVLPETPVKKPTIPVDTSYNPFHTRSGAIYPDRPAKNWETLYDGLSDYRQPEIPDESQLLLPADVESCALWQYGGKYILLPSVNGLVLIHQHRAHAAILYAQFLEQLTLTQGAMQQLLFPEVLTLPQEEMVLMNQLLPDLKSIGFDLEQLSPDSYSINGIPAQLANQSAMPVLQHILQQVRERGADTQTEWREQIALTLAETAAIPSGKSLTEPEMRDLVTRLVQLPNYRRSAEGKLIVSLLTDDEINKRF